MDIDKTKSEILEFILPVIAKWFEEHPKNYKGWHNYFIFITGNDTFEQCVSVSKKNVVLSPARQKMSFQEYIVGRLIWYVLEFPLDTIKIQLLKKSDIPTEIQNSCWSSRMGKTLNKRLGKQ